MQVSTRLFYDRAAASLGTLGSKADTLQTQIATGKRLAQASDDSVAYTRLRGIATASADADVSAKNLDTAASVLAQADSTLDAVTAQLQRASELAVRARTGTMNATDREAIAVELDAIVEQLAALGNATDPRGQPLFGGADGGAAVIRNADGSYGFATTLPSAIPTGDGRAVQPGDTAARLFVQTGGNTLQTIVDLAAALRTGTTIDASVGTAITKLTDAQTQVTSVQASLGARAQRVEMDQASLKQAGIDREAVRSGLEDTDVTATITELQKTMTILSATQASFTKLQGLSLFDYLR